MFHFKTDFLDHNDYFKPMNKSINVHYISASPTVLIVDLPHVDILNFLLIIKLKFGQVISEICKRRAISFLNISTASSQCQVASHNISSLDDRGE